MSKPKKKKLPQGCTYPDCFSCKLKDCVIPEDSDLLGDGDSEREIAELEQERKDLAAELKGKGISTRESDRYHKISCRIHYLKNKDLKKFKSKVRYMNRKKKG